MDLEADKTSPSAEVAGAVGESPSDGARLITDPFYLGLSGNISTLTAALQRHFDTLILENQRLKEERDEARREITHLMYLRDGATRVVAKQLDEITLLKKRVAELELGAAQSPAAEMGDNQPPFREVPPEVYQQVTEKFNTLSKVLLQNRKQRIIQARLPEAWKTYVTAYPASDPQDFRGATCFANLVSGVEESKSNQTFGQYVQRFPHLFAVGNERGGIQVHAWRQRGPVASLLGHDGPVTCLNSLLFPSSSHLRPSALAALGASSSSPAPFRSALNLFSGGADGTVRLWASQSWKGMENIDALVDIPTPSVGGPCKYADLNDRTSFSRLDFACDHVFRLHDRTGGDAPSAIKFVKLHPGGTHLATATSTPESGWTLLDLVTLKLVKIYNRSNVTCSDLTFQPDGNIVVGIDPSGSGSLPVWDLRSADLKASPKPPNITGHLTSVDFSEIGYYIVTSTSCGKGQLWDLRRAEVVQEYQLDGPVRRAKFDFSGRHIVFAGSFGTVVYSTQDKKNFAQAGVWDTDCAPDGIIDAHFDHVTDDYLVTMAPSSSDLSPIRCHMAK